MGWRIRITNPKGKAKRVKLDKFPVVIGRDDSADIAVDDRQVSRRHVQLIEENEFLRFMDLGTTNGTYLNGRKMMRGNVSGDDRLKIGETLIEFEPEANIKVEEDTGKKRLDILKAFTPGGPKRDAKPAGESRSDVLARIGAGGGEPGAVSSTAGAEAGRRLALLADVGMALSELEELEPIVEIFLNGVIDILPLDRAAILLRNPATGTLEPISSVSAPGCGTRVVVSRTICHHVYSQGTAIVTEDAVADPRFQSGDSIMENRVGAVIAAPIISRGKTLGVLYAASSERAARFTEGDLSFLSLLGSLVGVSAILSGRYD